MELIRDTTLFEVAGHTAVSFGKFDGLHMGHKLLVERLLQKKKSGLMAVAFSFAAPPGMVANQSEARLLTTNEEKEKVFEKTGIDYLIEYPFTKQIREMPALEFLKKIVRQLQVSCIIVGTDFRFGYKRKGDIALLFQEAPHLGYSLEVVDKMQYHGRDISSTMIREFITQGDIGTANTLLGYPYFLQGIVQHGKKIGRTIGVPTVNMLPPAGKLLPPFGGYASRILLNGAEYYGITNIGKNPTISDGNPVLAETHIFDFSGEIYGERLTVEFLEFIRGEKKFESIDALKMQILADIGYVQEKYLRT